jgi:uncharacterized protein YndB with AHSA1/START domain
MLGRNVIVGDSVRVTVSVPVPPAEAFEVFTLETDLWWRRGPKYRVAGRNPGALAFEPKLGGRLFEHYELAGETRTHVAGTITAWDPPSRLAFEWRGSNFAPGEITFVDIHFEPTESGGTRVLLEHRGFAALRPDHPVRHGQADDAFIRDLGMWWGELLMFMREHAINDEPAAS